MSEERKDGGSAFPKADDRDPLTGQGIMQGSSGMSLRDWFAGQALTGMCANPDVSRIAAKERVSPERLREAFAHSAYDAADQMLRARQP